MRAIFATALVQAGKHEEGAAFLEQAIPIIAKHFSITPEDFKATLPNFRYTPFEESLEKIGSTEKPSRSRTPTRKFSMSTSARRTSSMLCVAMRIAVPAALISRSSWKTPRAARRRRKQVDRR